jgi:hypothetical protein
MEGRAAFVSAALTLVLLVGLAGARAGAVESGEPVSGLSVTLTAAGTAWPVGTAMVFEATLTNVGDRVFLLDLFGDLDALYEGKRRSDVVTSCWTLAWRGTAGPVGPRRGRYTLDQSQFVRLAPGQSHTKRLSLQLGEFPPGTYRVRLAYVPRAATSSFSFPDRWQEQHRLRDPMWTGMAFSNELTIDVVTDPPSP